MENQDLIKINNEDLKLVKEKEDIKLVMDCISEIKNLQMATSLPQWEYTLEKSQLNGQMQYPNDMSRYLQVKLQIYSVINRIVYRHYQFNKLTAEIEILQAEIEILQKRLFKTKKMLAEVKLRQNDIMLKQYHVYNIKYGL